MALLLSFSALKIPRGTHSLSHCTTQGASCAEFQPHLVYYTLLNFCFIFVIIPLYFFLFLLSTPFLLLYILHIFVLSFFLAVFPCYFPSLFIFHSYLFLLLCFPFMSHFILSSLLRPYRSILICFSFICVSIRFVVACKSKRRFPSHVVMRRAS
jgi:hypothetical protein